MSRTIPYFEYRRRVFNTALLEAIRKPFLEAVGITESLTSGPVGPIGKAPTTVGAPPKNELGAASDPLANAQKLGADAIGAARSKLSAKNEAASQPDLKSADAAPTNPDGSEKKAKKDEKPLNSCGPEDLNLCESMCDSYYIEELHLNEATIDQTIARLKNANHYIVEACEECKEIADNAEKDARENKKEITEDDSITLTPEDNEVLDQLFHAKGPGPQIDQIRDATVKALLAEEKKSKEVRDALDLAQSKVSSGDVNAYNETANRLNRVGPTSLMGAIMNNMSRAAIRSVNEAGNFTSVGDVMAENADMIKTRSVMLYAIMETGNQLEITHMSSKDVERLANNIFYQK